MLLYYLFFFCKIAVAQLIILGTTAKYYNNYFYNLFILLIKLFNLHFFFLFKYQMTNIIIYVLFTIKTLFNSPRR